VKVDLQHGQLLFLFMADKSAEIKLKLPF